MTLGAGDDEGCAGARARGGGPAGLSSRLSCLFVSFCFPVSSFIFLLCALRRTPHTLDRSIVTGGAALGGGVSCNFFSRRGAPRPPLISGHLPASHEYRVCNPMWSAYSVSDTWKMIILCSMCLSIYSCTVHVQHSRGTSQTSRHDAV